MALTLAFDVYGTLIDTHGLVEQLEQVVGEDARALSETWRSKQLEYAFRRGLMSDYLPFSECTRSALEYACAMYRVSLSQDQKAELMAMYCKLPAFSDARIGLSGLSRDGIRPYAFSNGARVAVRELMQFAGLDNYFVDMVSVDDIKTFKPNPAVYDYFLKCSGAAREDTWLISCNAFDVLGALRSGIKAAWVKRSPNAVFDDWAFEGQRMEPTLVVNSLEGIGDRILQYN